MNELAARFQAFERRFPTKRQRTFGVSTSALLELFVFFGLALLIDLIGFDGHRFQGVEPHPFWIPVILLAVQYGTTEGLLAALVATAALLIGAMPEQTFGQDIYDYLRHVTAEPLMWCVAAIVVGELASRRRRRLVQTERALVDARQEADGLADAYAKARQTKDKLEARLASDLRTTLALYDGARAIERSSTGDVLRGAVELVRGVLGPEKFSIFLLNGDVLEAAVQEGWETGDGFRRVLRAEDPIYRAIVGEDRRLCAAYRDHAEILRGQGVLAAPLAGGPDGRPVGMLKVEALSFADLTTTAVENFRLAADWIGAALERARRAETLESHQVMTDDGAALSAALYRHEAALIARLGERFGFACAKLVIEAENAHTVDADVQRSFARALTAATEEALRDTDLAFDLGRHGRRYAILLPGADAMQARPVAERLEQALSRLAPAEVTVGGVRVRAENLEPPR